MDLIILYMHSYSTSYSVSPCKRVGCEATFDIGCGGTDVKLLCYPAIVEAQLHSTKTWDRQEGNSTLNSYMYVFVQFLLLHFIHFFLSL